jgi:hypothetical protein
LRQDTRIEEVSILGRGLKSCLVLRASLFASHISNSETKDSSLALWNIGQWLTLLLCGVYVSGERELADFGVPELQPLELLYVVQEYQH